MTASAQPKLTYDRPAGLLTHEHAKVSAKPAQKLLAHSAPVGLLGYSPKETPKEAADQPRTSGLRSKARGAKAAQADSGNGSGHVPGTALVPLTQAFDNTAFLKLLALIYGVNEIEKARADKLSGFTLDPSKGEQNGADGKLFAKLGNASVEITKESVLTDSALTPALAYQMAAAAAANPNCGKLVLEGTEDEKIMLFFAAQQLGLEIEDSSIPEIPANIADLAKTFHDYEQEMNLPNIAGTYLPQEEKKAPVAKKPARPQPTAQAPHGAFAVA